MTDLFDSMFGRAHIVGGFVKRNDFTRSFSELLNKLGSADDDYPMVEASNLEYTWFELFAFTRHHQTLNSDIDLRVCNLVGAFQLHCKGSVWHQYMTARVEMGLWLECDPTTFDMRRKFEDELVAYILSRSILPKENT